jgi:DNA-binding transcriptional ArsR family regulator
VPDVFAALADPNRRRLLGYLAERETATATELAAELPVTRQAVAKHLTALRAAGLVEPRRQGRETRYRLTPEPLAEAMTWIAEVGAQWDGRLQAGKAGLPLMVGAAESAPKSAGRPACAPAAARTRATRAPRRRAQ